MPLLSEYQRCSRGFLTDQAQILLPQCCKAGQQQLQHWNSARIQVKQKILSWNDSKTHLKKNIFQRVLFASNFPSPSFQFLLPQEESLPRSFTYSWAPGLVLPWVLMLPRNTMLSNTLHTKCGHWVRERLNWFLVNQPWHWHLSSHLALPFWAANYGELTSAHSFLLSNSSPARIHQAVTQQSTRAGIPSRAGSLIMKLHKTCSRARTASQGPILNRGALEQQLALC